jgi:hypothetical protein
LQSLLILYFVQIVPEDSLVISYFDELSRAELMRVVIDNKYTQHQMMSVDIF